MTVPSYKAFIEPILRFLAQQETSASSDAAREAAARALKLTAADRAIRLKSGKLTYRDRAGWAFDRLKRAELAFVPVQGKWELTEAGRDFAAANPSLTEGEVARLAAVEGPSSSRNSIRASRQETTSIPVPTPEGDRRAYRLPNRPIAIGGQAEVFEALRKSDGQLLVLKRVRGVSGEPRMRREIEIQSSLVHPNIMPILDWDRARFRWYVMPRGSRVMSTLVRPVEQSLLCEILEGMIAALEFAHAAGHPHRDIKPHNIVELVDEDHRSRWVLADWGLTRRPLGETSLALTKSDHALGTDGYAPPEAYRDAHSVGETGDIYALGQVIAWATGEDPIPNVPPRVGGPWGRLVTPMTRLDLHERMQTLAEVRTALQDVCFLLDNKASQRAHEALGFEVVDRCVNYRKVL